MCAVCSQCSIKEWKALSPPLNHETEKIYTHLRLHSSVPGTPIQWLLLCLRCHTDQFTLLENWLCRFLIKIGVPDTHAFKKIQKTGSAKDILSELFCPALMQIIPSFCHVFSPELSASSSSASNVSSTTSDPLKVFEYYDLMTNAKQDTSFFQTIKLTWFFM